MDKFMRFCAITALLCLPIISGAAIEEADDFPVSRQIEDTTFVLTGAHDFEFWFADVYSIALYTNGAAGSLSEIERADTAKVLHLVYHRSIDAEDIAKATRVALQEMPGFDAASHEALINEICNAYSSVKKGDQYEIIYLQEDGLSVALNGEVQFTTDSYEFIKAFYAIWISDEGLDEDMAEDLRGE